MGSPRAALFNCWWPSGGALQLRQMEGAPVAVGQVVLALLPLGVVLHHVAVVVGQLLADIAPLLRVEDLHLQGQAGGGGEGLGQG